MVKGQYLKYTLAVLLLFLLYIVYSFSPPNTPNPTHDSFTLKNVTVIEPTISRRPQSVLSIKNGKISNDTTNTTAIDFSGHFVLPGLINTHIHLPNRTPIYLTEYLGLLYISHGITSVRDAGDLSGTGADAAREAFIKNGNAGPRINSCGPMVEGETEGVEYENYVYMKDTESANGVINHIINAGGECVKSHDFLDQERTTALVKAANNKGLPVMGHISHGLTLETSDIPNVQHLLGVTTPAALKDRHDLLYRRIDWRTVDQQRLEEIVAISTEKNLTHTPTLVSLDNLSRFETYHESIDTPQAMLLPRFFREVIWHPTEGLLYRNMGTQEFDLIRDSHPKKIQLVGMLHRAGVELQLGTDDLQPFGVPGEALWREMGWFAQAGIPLEDIWAYGTWKSAREFGVDHLGLIREGAPADLLVFSKDPTKNLTNLTSLVAIIRDGKLYYKEDIDKAIARFQDFYKQPLIDLITTIVAKRSIDTANRNAH